ncbi:hypothetical protein ACS96_28575 [Pseudomonas aeruginosa]|nr:hypothetical protein ACS96_28575 [Pseudomonas aeruginosa]
MKKIFVFAALAGSAVLAGCASPQHCTTPGSARVEVSPRLSSSLQAILRRIRRMILPERVFGRLGAHCR